MIESGTVQRRMRPALVSALCVLALGTLMPGRAARAEDARELTRDGQVAYRQDRLDEAKDKLERAISLDASLADAYQWLGFTYLAYGRGSDARWAFVNAAGKGGTDPEIQRGLGDALLMVGAVDSAGAAYQACLAAKPKSEEAQLGMGRVLLGQNKPDEALAALQAGEKKAKRKAPYYAWQGAALAAQAAIERRMADSLGLAGDTPNAKAHLDKSQQLFNDASTLILRGDALEPQNADIKERLGDAYMLQGNGESAADSYGKATALAKDRADLFYKLGRAQAKARSYTDAVDAYRQATNIDSTFVDAWFQAGNLYYLGDQFDNAARMFQHLTTLQPNAAASWLRYGEALFKGKFYNEAIPALQRALEIEPDSCGAGKMLGDAVLFLAGGKDRTPAERDSMYDVARRAYNTSLQHCAEAPCDLYIRVGKLNRLKKDYVEMASAYEKAVSCDSTMADPWLQLGLAYFYQSNYDKAIPILQKVIALDGSNSLAYLNLGLSYYGKSQWTEAAETLVKADSLLPQDNGQARSNALNWAGWAQYYLKDVASAQATFEKAVALDPNNGNAKKGLDFVTKAAKGGGGASAPAPKGAAGK